MLALGAGADRHIPLSLLHCPCQGYLPNALVIILGCTLHRRVSFFCDRKRDPIFSHDNTLDETIHRPMVIAAQTFFVLHKVIFLTGVACSAMMSAFYV